MAARKTKRPIKVVAELSVGLTQQMAELLQFASDTTSVPPSIIARLAISEMLVSNQWPEKLARAKSAASCA